MEFKNITAGIVGGAGYTGGELVRLLLNHPHVSIACIHSRSHAGAYLYQVHADLLGETELKFSDELQEDIDVLFLCTGHGEAKTFLNEHQIDERIVVIDLSQDFRLAASAATNDRQFIYGLPEVNRTLLKTANAIANPGCFATGIQLALLPLAAKGLLQEVHVTGITGATGAGQKLQTSSHFAWRANNIQAYKSLAHQHMAEILQTLSNLQSGFSDLHFVPWRGDFTRGIYLTAYTECDLSAAGARSLYRDYYETHPFVHLSDSMIDLKQTVNTNKCLLHIEKAGSRLLVHAALDNLLKGASGQAVQNMNIRFELPETTGLKLKAVSF